MEKDNQELEQERSGMDQRIEEKAEEIHWIEQELGRIERAIREMAERIAERARELLDQSRGWERSR